MKLILMIKIILKKKFHYIHMYVKKKKIFHLHKVLIKNNIKVIIMKINLR